MRYILAVIALLAFSMKSNGQAKLYDNINSQADVDSVANGIALDYYDYYILYLENDTTLPINEQIHDVSALGQNGDTLNLYMYHTRVSSISGVAQSCEIRGFASVNNPLLTDVSPIMNSSVYRFILEETPISGDLVFDTSNDQLDFEVTNCDQITSIELNAPNLVDPSSPGLNNQIIIQDNDSLNNVSLSSTNNEWIVLLNIKNNRKLDSVYLDLNFAFGGIENNNELGGFIFNENLSVINIESPEDIGVSAIAIKYNYALEDFCDIKPPIMRMLQSFSGTTTDSSEFYQITQNAQGINTLEELINYDCISTGFEELRKNEVVVYPNPANDGVFIKGINNATPYEFYSLTGEVVKTGTLQANGVIDVNQFSSGVYLLKIGEQTEKVIVQ